MGSHTAVAFNICAFRGLDVFSQSSNYSHAGNTNAHRDNDPYGTSGVPRLTASSPCRFKFADVLGSHAGHTV
jgi:hypothetical protein